MIEHKALDLNSNVWINANAGSGKTTILVKRIITTIMQQGNAPSIYAITYTTAAAGEIKKRVLEQLMRCYKATDDQIAQIQQQYHCAHQPWDKIIANIKPVVQGHQSINISTIHSLAINIIQQQPEYHDYQIAPNEKEMAILMARHKNQVLQWLKEQVDANIINVQTLQYLSDLEIENICKHCFSNSLELKAINSSHPIIAALSQDVNISEVVQQTESIFSSPALDRALQAQNSHPKQISKKLAQVLTKVTEIKSRKQTSDPAKLKAFLNASVDESAKMYNKEMHDKNTALAAELTDLGGHAKKIYDLHQQYLLNELNELVAQIAKHAIVVANQIKSRHKIIDYQDMLLLASTITEQEFYGFQHQQQYIKHLLVDEAQDTNRLSWNIIHNITSHFEISDDLRRTIFIVGDEKQSIYSFQGSDIDVFYEAKAVIKNKSGHNFHSISMQKSYRTQQKILDLVDAVMNKINATLGISSSEHISHAAPEEARIKLHTIAQKATNDKDIKAWQHDLIHGPSDYNINIINQVADVISEEIKSGTKPEDIMVLVPQRTTQGNIIIDIIDEVIKRNIHTNGIDRFDVNHHIITQDIISILMFLQNPNSVINIIRCLRSFMLKATLSQAITAANIKTLEDLKLLFPQHYSQLTQLLLSYRRDGLKSTLNKIFLNAEHRDYIHAKFGQSGEDVLNFIAKLANEDASSFTTVSAAIRKLNHKYTIDNRSNREGVYFTTIHSSKGMEASCVVIVDLEQNFQGKSASKRNKLHFSFNKLFYITRKDVSSSVTKEFTEQLKKKELKEKGKSVYVALTRAKKTLHIIGKESNNSNDLAKSNLLTICKNCL